MFFMQGACFSFSNCDYFLLGKPTPSNSTLVPFYRLRKETCRVSLSLSRLRDSRVTLNVQAICSTNRKDPYPFNNPRLLSAVKIQSHFLCPTPSTKTSRLLKYMKFSPFFEPYNLVPNYILSYKVLLIASNVFVLLLH